MELEDNLEEVLSPQPINMEKIIYYLKLYRVTRIVSSRYILISLIYTVITILCIYYYR